MKRTILFLLLLTALAGASNAQAPQRLSYQAEIRNTSNALVINTLVGMRFSIRQGSTTGTIAYQERHTPTTNANGLVSLQIGGGTVLSGVFANINWASGPYFLQTETDPAGGTNYTISGTQQLLSVPYALFSNSAGNGVSNGSFVNQMLYWNGTTWSNLAPPNSQGQVLTYCDGTLTWTIGGICPGTVAALTCASATNTGTLTQGTAASGVSSSVPFTGGNGGTHSGQTVTSTGVTGLTATLIAGTFANGAGNLTYTITGTPASSGTASFALNIGGKTCTLSRTVALPFGTIAALTCASATNTGTLTQGTAASGVSSSVPYTGGNGGTHNGQTVTSTGVTGLTATLIAGTFANGAGNLTYTITGTPASSGTASFALNIGGKTCTLSRTVALPVGTISALNCSTATNSGTLAQGIAATSVSSTVPYTGGNGGSHSGQTVTSTGVIGLTATRAAGNFATGSGTLIYTITGTPATSGTASFALNIGGQTCILTRTVLASASITALSCSTATNNGTLTQGVASSSVSSSVPYTGGNGGYRSAQTVTSTGVTGLTATRTAGTLATGSGSISYTITGTPASSGTASFAISIGGQSCTLTRTVNPPLGTITALNCSTATNTGTLTQGIAAASVSSSIPYTGGNGGTYSAQSIISTGVIGLTATLAAGTLLSGAGSLTYTITGIPASSGTASFTLSIGGQTCTLTRTVDSGTPHTCGAINVHNPAKTYGSMTDQEGNVYKTIIIGSQEWMAENLKTGIYRNGSPIENVIYDGNWADLASGAWCYYNNNAQFECPYGRLYNWYAVADSRNLCPVGWHVPTDAEWTTLTNLLGGIAEAGGKMKSTGATYWQSPNAEATNESGFSALPGGGRSVFWNSFYDFGINGFWWSSTQIGSSFNASSRTLLHNYGNVIADGPYTQFGYSVRCIRD
jgi:uncharacterized protein (TIGR02145 family)